MHGESKGRAHVNKLMRSGQLGASQPLLDRTPPDLGREMTREDSCQYAEFRNVRAPNYLQFHRRELLHWYLREGMDELGLTEHEDVIQACEGADELEFTEAEDNRDATALPAAAPRVQPSPPHRRPPTPRGPPHAGRPDVPPDAAAHGPRALPHSSGGSCYLALLLTVLTARRCSSCSVPPGALTARRCFSPARRCHHLQLSTSGPLSDARAAGGGSPAR